MVGMKRMLLLPLIIYIRPLGTPPIDHGSPAPTTVKAACWPSWLSSSSPVSTIDTSYFTHVFDALLTPDPVSYELTVSESDRQSLAIQTTLHHKNPPEKILLSIAGNHASLAWLPKLHRLHQLRLDGNKDSMDLIPIGTPSTQEMEDIGVLMEEWRLALS